MSLLDYTAVELAAKIKAGETTATEAMEAVIAQIEKSEDELNCYLTFDKEKALAADVYKRQIQTLEDAHITIIIPVKNGEMQNITI